MFTPYVPVAAPASVLPARALVENMTSSNNHVGWISSASGRSTSDILWSCFSILLVCTYKCIHFNVPSREENKAGWFKWHGLYLPEALLWWNWARKPFCMLVIVLAPEIGVALAMDQYLHARECRHTICQGDEGGPNNGEVAKDGMWEAETGEGEEPKCTNSQAFFANMGGFTLRLLCPSPPEQIYVSQDGISQVTTPVPVGDERPTLIPEVSFPIIDGDDLADYLRKLPGLRIPSTSEIDSLSKTDAFTKAFACIQSSWLVIQSIVRVSVGLPITQLELATMAFVACALVMYMLWWNKPFGVENRATITVIAYDIEARREMAGKLSHSLVQKSIDRRLGEKYESAGRIYYTKMFGLLGRGERVPLTEFNQAKDCVSEMDQQEKVPDFTWGQFFELAITEDLFSKDEFSRLGEATGIMVRNVFKSSGFARPPREQTSTLAFYITGTLFSAIHIAAWNWEFPSPIVRLLWRIFGITATSTGPIAILFLAIIRVIAAERNSGSESALDYLAKILLALLLLFYVSCRIGLIVLVFYCFSSMPAGVYQTVNWTQFLPHFS